MMRMWVAACFYGRALLRVPRLALRALKSIKGVIGLAAYIGLAWGLASTVEPLKGATAAILVISAAALFALAWGVFEEYGEAIEDADGRVRELESELKNAKSEIERFKRQSDTAKADARNRAVEEQEAANQRQAAHQALTKLLDLQQVVRRLLATMAKSPPGPANYARVARLGRIGDPLPKPHQTKPEVSYQTKIKELFIMGQASTHTPELAAMIGMGPPTISHTEQVAVVGDLIDRLGRVIRLTEAEA